ncbi:hypothetical protein [Formosa sp. PL04]|uniref:hypothetical protein n=1 Tax=Formosa sp. PL04 TaxID=3081755 RepID=UPI00298125E8|nr:hypothetical protein [Formosa sp. PL04]MDW5290367.1 hypothetical protein [Formosa sp. PL04]
MKKALYILILISFGFKCADDNCELKNGRYKVVYDKQFSEYPKFEFEINGQNLTEINSEQNRNYIIENLGENTFQLKSLEKQTDSLTDFQKALISNGKPYYEITDCKNDTIEFTMRVNLHVFSHSGKFVRLE